MYKKNKIVIYSCVFAGLLISAALILPALFNKNQNSGNSSVSSASVLATVENSFDFNTISMKNGSVSHKFEVKNTGVEPVKINKIYTSCMCTTAKVTDGLGKLKGVFGMPGHGNYPSKTNINVDPGELIAVEAVFDPAAHGPSGVGLMERAIYLETNSTESPLLELTIQAVVTN